MYGKWIKKGIDKPGKSAVGLAAFISKALKLKKPMHRVTVYKMIAGTRSVYSEELAPISTYIEEPIPYLPAIQTVQLMDVVSIQIEREIGVGLWFEPDIAKEPSRLGVVVVPRDVDFPESKAVAFICRGDSMIDAAILDGDVLVCIPPTDDANVEGRQVIIERNRAGLIELSPRMVSIYKDRIEYRSCSHAGNYKPIVVRKSGKKTDETVKVVAIIRQVISKR